MTESLEDWKVEKFGNGSIVSDFLESKAQLWDSITYFATTTEKFITPPFFQPSNLPF
jgi:hypothetical protein